MGAAAAEVAGLVAEPVRALLHRIADKDQRLTLAFSVSAGPWVEGALDLCLAADARDLAHQGVKTGRGTDRARSLALAVGAVEHQLADLQFPSADAVKRR